MLYNTYIDESGNTGNNLVDSAQKYFTLAAVSIPQTKEAAILSYIQEKFDSVNEIGETEIKAARWIRSDKKALILKSILDYLKGMQCDFSLVILEKRFMVCALIVDNFLDGAYNDFEDYTWCNDKDEKRKAAQYFYDILDDKDIELISSAFTHPELEKYQKAYDLVFAKTHNLEYKRMLAGLHLEELYKDDYEAVMFNTDANPSVVRSANYVTFTALGMRVCNVCKRKNYRTNFIFDNSLLCNEAFKKLYERFHIMENSEILEVWAGIISWKSWVESFSVANSKSSFLLQTADVLATSVMKTLEKIFSDGILNGYDEFVKTLIKEMLEDDQFFFVMSDRNVRKLAQIMNASSNTSI